MKKDVKEPQKNIKLITGRVYVIKPDPLPGFEAKSRPAIYIGFKVANKTKKHLFIQIGTSKIELPQLVEFCETISEFWTNMNSEGYFHIDISKYEYFRVVRNTFNTKRTESGYVDLEYKKVQELFEIYKNRIDELEKIRLIKAKKYAVSGDYEQAKRQLHLLKIAMPEKHAKMNPEALIKKWKKAFDSF